jgi:hypothetical protein
MNRSHSKLAIFFLFIVVAIISYFYFSGQELRMEVRSFNECVDSGYAVNTEAYPAYCTTPQGKRFFAFVDPDNWKTYRDEKGGLAYKYPESLGFKYAEAIVWPPEVTFREGTFSCVETKDGPSQTVTRSIEGRNYCVTLTTEELNDGRSVARYTYATEIAGAEADYFVHLGFDVRTLNCGDLESPQAEECQGELDDLNFDVFLNRIMRTVWINRQAGEDKSISSLITIQGSFGCLPPHDREGPVNDICMFGLLGDDGNYYSLFEDDSENPVLWRFSDGDRVFVRGLFQPETHEMFQRIGIIKVETVRPASNN